MPPKYNAFVVHCYYSPFDTTNTAPVVKIYLNSFIPLKMLWKFVEHFVQLWRSASLVWLRVGYWKIHVIKFTSELIHGKLVETK